MCHMTSAMNPGGLIPEFDISDRVRKARETSGLKQEELAERTGMTRTGLARIEQGKSNPRRSTLILISFATGVSLNWLETGKTPTTPGSDGGERWGHRGSNPGPTDYGSTPSYQHTAGVA